MKIVQVVGVLLCGVVAVLHGAAKNDVAATTVAMESEMSLFETSRLNLAAYIDGFQNPKLRPQRVDLWTVQQTIIFAAEVKKFVDAYAAGGQRFTKDELQQFYDQMRLREALGVWDSPFASRMATRAKALVPLAAVFSKVTVQQSTTLPSDAVLFEVRRTILAETISSLLKLPVTIEIRGLLDMAKNVQRFTDAYAPGASGLTKEKLQAIATDLKRQTKDAAMLALIRQAATLVDQKLATAK